MRPVDFIGQVVNSESKQVVSHVEGTIFQYEDHLMGNSGWSGSFITWKDQAALLAAHHAGEPLLLVCNDGRQGAIVLDPEVADWGTGFTFRGAGPLSEAKVAPSWQRLDRTHSEDGAPDPTQ